MSKPSPATVKERLLEWVLDGNTGSSSLAVARALLYGANNQEVDEFPREPVNLAALYAAHRGRARSPRNFSHPGHHKRLLGGTNRRLGNTHPVAACRA